jgi:hypothetical protein
MAKKREPWEEGTDGYVVLIVGTANGPRSPKKAFVAYASDNGQQWHLRAFYRKRKDAEKARRTELSQFATVIARARLSITSR